MVWLLEAAATAAPGVGEEGDDRCEKRTIERENQKKKET
jgi:hypothetical protein